MNFSIKTVYNKEDIEGLYDAFIASRRHIHITRKISKVISTVLAALFWIVAAGILIAMLVNGDRRQFLRGLPIVIVFAGIGLLMFAKRMNRIRSKLSWKAYPHKGKQLAYNFNDGDFTLEQEYSVAKISYAGIIRIYEDSKRFYLFDSPQTAHILPKRDFDKTPATAFGAFITEKTGLQMG